MGLIALLRSFSRVTRKAINVSDVKLDPGGGPNLTGQHFAPSGDDSHPLPGDYVYAASAPQRGRVAVLGYVDPVNPPQSQPGEKRVYARDGTGAVIVEIWLQNDGTAILSNDAGSMTLGSDGSILGQNANGSFALQAAGDFVVNGVTISVAGLITTPTGIVTPSALVNSVEVDGHGHAQANDSGGNTEQDTGPMQ